MTPKAEQSDLQRLITRVKKLETSYTDIVSKIDTIIELYNKQVDLLQSNLTAVTKNNDMLIEQAKGRKWGKYRQYGLYVFMMIILAINTLFPSVGQSIKDGIGITAEQVKEVTDIINE